MLKNKTRFIPTGFVQFTPELGDYPKDMFACYADVSRLQAIFFIGKQTNHAWYNSFRNVEDMKNKIKTSISSLMSFEERKQKNKVERKEKFDKALAEMKIGDLFYSSWGYEQTNVDFYQVTEKKGKTFTVKQIHSATVKDSTMPHGMADDRVPFKNSFLDETQNLHKLLEHSN